MERCGGNKKLLADAQTMLADSRRKIDYMRMQQLQLRNMKPRAPEGDCNYYNCYLLFCVNYAVIAFRMAVLLFTGSFCVTDVMVLNSEKTFLRHMSRKRSCLEAGSLVWELIPL